MILSKTFLITGLLTISINATTLKDIIVNTINNNQNIQSNKIQNKSLEKTYQSVQNQYNPTITIGANYLKLDKDLRNVQIGQTITGFAKISIDLYNGGKNNALKKQKQYQYQSGLHNNNMLINKTILQVVTLYYQTKTIIENIKVLQEKANALKAQYNRIKTKYKLQMTTQDEVLKFQAEYDSNQYQIAQLEYQKEQLLQTISLISHSHITDLDDVTLPNVSNLTYQPSQAIKALELSLKAQQENKNIIASSKKIQIKLEDNYNIYNYDDYNSRLLTDLPDQQNQLMLNISYKLFDTSSKNKIQAAQLAKQSIAKQLDYLQEQEQTNFQLAKKQLTTAKLKIISLKSAVKMANSVYKIIKTKYENGVVDNIAYLDALSKKIYNLALYKQALNDYEISKANYYFTSGIGYKQFLNIWE